jgi:hypothetical protein
MPPVALLPIEAPTSSFPTAALASTPDLPARTPTPRETPFRPTPTLAPLEIPPASAPVPRSSAAAGSITTTLQRAAIKHLCIGISYLSMLLFSGAGPFSAERVGRNTSGSLILIACSDLASE